MLNNKFTFFVAITVDKDGVPGFGNTPDSWIEFFKTNMRGAAHYNPDINVLSFAQTNKSDEKAEKFLAATIEEVKSVLNNGFFKERENIFTPGTKVTERKCVHEKTGREVKVGEELETFRGEKCIFNSFDKYRNRIYVTMNGVENSFFASVCGLKFIDPE